MAGDPNAAARSPAVQKALSVVQLGVQAAGAYKRPDLVDRLDQTSRRLADPAFHVFVVGEFKQGKSSMVNALLNAPVCPVDDDIATSAPTAVRYGEEPGATLLLKPPEDPDAEERPEPIRQPIPVDEVAQYVTEASNPDNERQVQTVEISVPRKLLADGLTLVDTPGVGGLGSAHSAATIAALPMADAVVFVSDASQEFTNPEIEFLQTALRMCPNVICVQTKIDFYPAWRKIRDLNLEHLSRHGIEAPLMCVSSALRIHALRTNDRALNQESGFPALVGYLQNDIAANAEKITVRNAVSHVISVTGMLAAQFQNERKALANPEAAREVVGNLNELKEQAARLRTNASRWQQALGDGIIDLQTDLEHDMRSRLRHVTKQADTAIDQTDPADTWDDFQAWLYRRVAEDVVHTYMMLYSRAEDLAGRVSQNFGDDGGEMSVQFQMINPYDVVASVQADTDLKTEKMSLAGQGLAGMRGSYGGMLMFGMLSGPIITAALGTTVGMLNPFAGAIGLLMGRKALRDEKERQLNQRRAQAKQVHRKYCEEVQFVVGKDAKDTLRRLQRQMRDFFTTRAEELHQSTNEALKAAQGAAQSDETTRKGRLRDVNAELERINGLRRKALELAPELAEAGKKGAGAKAGAAKGADG